MSKNYAKLAFLYGCDIWCLKKSEMGILLRTKILADSNVWSTGKGRKGAKDLM